MKLIVNKDLCINCGACYSECPESYAEDNDGFAYVKVDEIKKEDEEKALQALENCPTNAIEKAEDKND